MSKKKAKRMVRCPCEKSQDAECIRVCPEDEHASKSGEKSAELPRKVICKESGEDSIPPPPECDKYKCEMTGHLPHMFPGVHTFRCGNLPKDITFRQFLNKMKKKRTEEVPIRQKKKESFWQRIKKNPFPETSPRANRFRYRGLDERSRCKVAIERYKRYLKYGPDKFICEEYADNCDDEEDASYYTKGCRCQHCRVTANELPAQTELADNDSRVEEKLKGGSQTDSVCSKEGGSVAKVRGKRDDNKCKKRLLEHESEELVSSDACACAETTKRHKEQDKKYKSQKKDPSLTDSNEFHSPTVETPKGRKDQGKKVKGKQKDTRASLESDELCSSSVETTKGRTDRKGQQYSSENAKACARNLEAMLCACSHDRSVENVKDKKKAPGKRQKKNKSGDVGESNSDIDGKADNNEYIPIECKNESSGEEPKKINRYVCREKINPCRGGPPEFVCEPMQTSSDDERGVELCKERKEQKKQMKYKCVDHKVKTKSRNKQNNEAPLMYMRTSELPEDDIPSNCKCGPSKKGRQRGGSHYHDKSEISSASISHHRQTNKKESKSFFSRLFGWSKGSPHTSDISNVVEAAEVSEETLVSTDASLTSTKIEEPSTKNPTVAPRICRQGLRTERKDRVQKTDHRETKPFATKKPIKEQQKQQ